MFTRCPSICPLLTKHMAELEKSTRDRGDRVRLVSFSIDPEYDSPAVLGAYAAAHGADSPRWYFLQGVEVGERARQSGRSSRDHARASTRMRCVRLGGWLADALTPIKARLGDGVGGAGGKSSAANRRRGRRRRRQGPPGWSYRDRC